MTADADSSRLIQEVRGFWDRRPCNLRHSPQEVGTKAYFDEVERRKYYVEPHIPPFADFARWKGKRVLEIGCGLGTDTVNFARAGARVTAVDLSERSIELAKQRAALDGLDAIDWHCGNAEELDAFLPAAPYDLIYSFGVVHHTPSPERVLQQLRRYAHPDTVVKLMVYHRRSWKAWSIFLRRGLGTRQSFDEVIARDSEAQSGCPVTYTYTRAIVSRLLAQAGLVVDQAEVEHIFPYVVSEYVQYRYVRRWPFRWLPRAWFRGLERRLGWHLCVTAHVDPAIALHGRREILS